MTNAKKYLWTLVLIAIIIGLVLWGKSASAPVPNTLSDSTALAGLQTSYAPWVAEIPHLRERLKSIGLPALSEEGSVLHIHQHLDIFVGGKVVIVPPGIGINNAAQFISPIHTHDASQVIHVESPTVQTFTLGQFFDIWGVKFSADCIGGYCAGDGKVLKVYANGTLVSGDPRTLELTAHEEIAVVYGTPSEAPATIPASYDFPAGE